MENYQQKQPFLSFLIQTYRNKKAKKRQNILFSAGISHKRDKLLYAFIIKESGGSAIIGHEEQERQRSHEDIEKHLSGVTLRP